MERKMIKPSETHISPVITPKSLGVLARRGRAAPQFSRPGSSRSCVLEPRNLLTQGEIHTFSTSKGVYHCRCSLQETQTRTECIQLSFQAEMMSPLKLPSMPQARKSRQMLPGLPFGFSLTWIFPQLHRVFRPHMTWAGKGGYVE